MENEINLKKQNDPALEKQRRPHKKKINEKHFFEGGKDKNLMVKPKK